MSKPVPAAPDPKAARGPTALARIKLVKMRADELPGALPRPDPLLHGLLTVVDRLQAVVNEETDSLARRAATDFAACNHLKRQGMLELSRAMRGFAGRTPPVEVRDRLAVLAAALDRNRAALDVQLGAVREVAEIIAAVIKDAEWDGTYSQRAATR